MIIVKDNSERITVAFHYNPSFVEKVKSIPDHRWYPDKKHWSFPDSDGTLEKILKVFKGEEIHLDPALQVSTPVIAKPEMLKQSQGTVPDLPAKQSKAVESGLSPTFEEIAF
ncbi:MAG: hypothetical protein HZA09_02540 [Nitrospirae bacterium]|nr:hypothetical protein [Nitrospirota bacterium]